MSVHDERNHDANAREEPALLTEQDAAALKAIRCTVHADPTKSFPCRHGKEVSYGFLCPAHQAEATAILKAMNDQQTQERIEAEAFRSAPPILPGSTFQMPVGATAADRLWPLTDERVDAFMEKAGVDAQREKLRPRALMEQAQQKRRDEAKPLLTHADGLDAIILYPPTPPISIGKAAGPTPSRYRWTFKGVTFDFYRLCEIIGVKRGPAQHALKKIIRAGLSIKPIEQEIDEAIDALLRWKEMIQEDNEA